LKRATRSSAAAKRESRAATLMNLVLTVVQVLSRKATTTAALKPALAANANTVPYRSIWSWFSATWPSRAL